MNTKRYDGHVVYKSNNSIYMQLIINTPNLTIPPRLYILYLSRAFV